MTNENTAIRPKKVCRPAPVLDVGRIVTDSVGLLPDGFYESLQQTTLQMSSTPGKRGYRKLGVLVRDLSGNPTYQAVTEALNFFVLSQ